MSDPRLMMLAKLFAAFPDQRRDGRLVGSIYLDAMADASDAEFAKGVEACIRVCRFFPSVAELRREAFRRELPKVIPPEHRLFPPEDRREPVTEESKARVSAILDAWRRGAA